MIAGRIGIHSVVLLLQYWEKDQDFELKKRARLSWKYWVIEIRESRTRVLIQYSLMACVLFACSVANHLAMPSPGWLFCFQFISRLTKDCKAGGERESHMKKKFHCGTNIWKNTPKVTIQFGGVAELQGHMPIGTFQALKSLMWKTRLYSTHSPKLFQAL